jgi:hypothetical protein
VPAYGELGFHSAFKGLKVGRDSSFGIATGRSGDRIPMGWDFPHPPTLALGPTQPPIQWVPGLSPGDKAVGAWRWIPIQSSVEVKERVELYRYSLSGPSWPVLGWSYLYILVPLNAFKNVRDTEDGVPFVIIIKDPSSALGRNVIIKYSKTLFYALFAFPKMWS